MVPFNTACNHTWDFKGKVSNQSRAPFVPTARNQLHPCDARSVQSFTGLSHHERCCTHTFIQRTQEWHQPWVIFTKQLCKNRRINNFALKGGTAYVWMHWDVETETLANEHPFCVPAYKRHRKPADRGLVQHVWHPSLKMELLYIYRFS